MASVMAKRILGFAARYARLAFIAGFVVACGGGGGGSVAPQPVPPQPVSIAILGLPAVALRPGESKQLSASVTYSDGAVRDVTATAAWGTANASVLAISPTGLLTALAPGQTEVIATSDGLTTRNAVRIAYAMPPGAMALLQKYTGDSSTSALVLDRLDGSPGIVVSESPDSLGGFAAVGDRLVFLETPRGGVSSGSRANWVVSVRFDGSGRVELARGGIYKLGPVVGDRIVIIERPLMESQHWIYQPEDLISIRGDGTGRVVLAATPGYDRLAAIRAASVVNFAYVVKRNGEDYIIVCTLPYAAGDPGGLFLMKADGSKRSTLLSVCGEVVYFDEATDRFLIVEPSVDGSGSSRLASAKADGSSSFALSAFGEHAQGGDVLGPGEFVGLIRSGALSEYTTYDLFRLDDPSARRTLLSDVDQPVLPEYGRWGLGARSGALLISTVSNDATQAKKIFRWSPVGAHSQIGPDAVFCKAQDVIATDHGPMVLVSTSDCERDCTWVRDPALGWKPVCRDRGPCQGNSGLWLTSVESNESFPLPGWALTITNRDPVAESWSPPMYSAGLVGKADESMQLMSRRLDVLDSRDLTLAQGKSITIHGSDNTGIIATITSSDRDVLHRIRFDGTTDAVLFSTAGTPSRITGAEPVYEADDGTLVTSRYRSGVFKYLTMTLVTPEQSTAGLSGKWLVLPDGRRYQLPSYGSFRQILGL